ncbi:BCAM0308 family protein [Sulfuricystis thermophila]|uniref:BCAM0308 family protein n=1 Tax=Sulfuricystis thermophila TaxID=2496847 RepID=UPI0010355DE5|nr:BCAM0308 family protein [Sulfuricystis thermophila]
MKANVPAAGFRPVRRDQLRPERIHDTYQLTHKLAEPSVCKVCGAIYHAGRWQWGSPPGGAHEVTCPACARIRDHLPMGYVQLSGDYFAAHRDELLKLVRHREEKEKAEHPLARIMAIEDQADGGVLVTTTDSHLARSIGEALEHAHKGELEFHYNEGDNLLRVFWER